MKKFKKGAQAATAFFIRAQADDQPHELLIYDVIGGSFWEEGVTAKAVLSELKAIGDQDVLVRINSAGGDTMDGTAIYTALANHKGHVTAAIEGYACSMASVIACAADTTTIGENSLVMIHKASTIVWGNADDLRATAEMMDKVDGTLIAAYVRKTGKSEEEIKALLDSGRDTWLTAAEALELGIVDEVTVPLKFAACLDKGAAALLGEREGAIILGRTPVPGALRDADGQAQAYRIDGDQVQAIAEEEDAPQGDDPGAEGEGAGGEQPGETPAGEEGGEEEGTGEGEDPPAPLDPAAIAAAERQRCSAIYTQARSLGLEHMAQGLIDAGHDLKTAGALLTQVKAGIDDGIRISNQNPANLQPDGQRAGDWGNAYQQYTRK